MALALSAVLLAAHGCAPLVSGRRFENRAPIWCVDDRDPIARPAPRPTTENATGLRDAPTPLLYALSIPRPRQKARGINSLGEVPTSSWFENRIGVRGLTAADIALGPGDGRGPVLPLVVVGSKRGGRALGVLVEDALGNRFLLKFDRRESPEVETANDVVSQRLLWASGYRVPEDSVVFFPRADLVLGDDATLTLATGEEVPMTAADLAELLARVAEHEPGTLRALASELLPGVPLGGYPAFGVRRDDPNDRIPHQHRRDVRAQQIFFAWLGHTDVKEGNTLDTWVRRDGSRRGHVVHHIVDFGLSLGAKARYDLRPHDGFAYDFDIKWGIISIVTLGLYPRPWERTPSIDLPVVGRYDVENFHPSHFRSTRPYIPFLFTDRFDAYWASKILIRFRREHVEAAVARARFSDPRTRRYLVDTILARQRKTARHWFGEVNPVDYFRFVRDGSRELLCADDLLLRFALEDKRATHYRVDSFDYEGVPTTATQELAGRPDGLVCLDAPAPPRRHEGYLMVRYRTRRGGRELPPVVAHFAPHPETGLLRLIGIDRR